MLSSGNIYGICLYEPGTVLGCGALAQAEALPSGKGGAVKDWTINKQKDGL
jgi:hypothetical protein